MGRPPPPSFPAQGSRGQGGGGRKARPSPQHPVGVSSLKPEPPAAGPHPQAVGWVGAHLPPGGPSSLSPGVPPLSFLHSPRQQGGWGRPAPSHLPPPLPLGHPSHPGHSTGHQGWARHRAGLSRPPLLPSPGPREPRLPATSQQAGLALDPCSVPHPEAHGTCLISCSEGLSRESPTSALPGARATTRPSWLPNLPSCSNSFLCDAGEVT